MRKNEIDVIYFRRLKLHRSRLKTYIDSMEIKVHAEQMNCIGNLDFVIDIVIVMSQ